MRSVSTRQLQDDFAGILRILREGEEIELVDRKRKIARIVPTRRARKSADWSQIRSRLTALWGDKPAPGKSASEIIVEQRR